MKITIPVNFNPPTNVGDPGQIIYKAFSKSLGVDKTMKTLTSLGLELVRKQQKPITFKFNVWITRKFLIELERELSIKFLHVRQVHGDDFAPLEVSTNSETIYKILLAKVNSI